MTRLSIFDMDRTITRTGTYTPWLIFWAAREAPWRLALLPISAVYGAAYLLKAVSRSRLKELNHALLMGGGARRAAVERRAAEYAAHVLDRNVFAGAVARLATERAEGRRIVLATASYEFYVRAIAARLGIADVIATGSMWDGDRLRPRLAGENCYGPAKLRMVEAWLARVDATDAHIRFFSDHVSDLPVFERAAEQIATTPSPKLRAVALARGWQVIDWY
jgi:phosphatidylglycerophosphatase C